MDPNFLTIFLKQKFKISFIFAKPLNSLNRQIFWADNFKFISRNLTQ